MVSKIDSTKKSPKKNAHSSTQNLRAVAIDVKSSSLVEEYPIAEVVN